METVHFCPPAAKEGKGRVWHRTVLGHRPPTAKSPHPKAQLDKSCLEALTM